MASLLTSSGAKSTQRGEIDSLLPHGASPSQEKEEDAQDDEDAYKHVLNGEQPLPIRDIRERWQTVALDAFIAILCAFPGLGIFALMYMWKEYSWKKYHILEKNRRILFVTVPGRLLEGVIWAQLLLDNISSAITYSRVYNLVRKEEELFDASVEILQVESISNTVLLGSVLFVRILLVHAVEVSAHISYHKKEVKKKMESDSKQNHRSKQLLRVLETRFKNLYRPMRETKVVHVDDIILKLESGWANVLVHGSTVFVALGYACLQINSWTAVAETSGTNGKVSIGGMVNVPKISVVQLLSSFVSCYFTVNNWHRLMKCLCSMTQRIENNTKQLLLFTTLTVQTSGELWSSENRHTLDQILQMDAGGKSVGSTQDKLDTSCMSKLEGLWDHPIDLLELGDIQTWWHLRNYTQVDFEDESAMMNFSSALTFMLLVCFALSGYTDWMIHNSPFSPGLLLACFLVTILALVLFDVLKACININSLLERDVQILVDAATEAAALPDEKKAVQVSVLLRAMERKVESFDNKQEMFGFPITANMRNGWFVSIFVTGVTAAWEIAKPILGAMQLEDVEDFVLHPLSNWTTFQEHLYIRSA